MIYEYRDYRSFLKNVLADRISQNPNYSLRAMARQVNIAPSMLSDVLNGKKNLSSESTIKIAYGLKLKPKETEYLQSLLQLEVVKSESVRFSILERLKSLSPQHATHDLSLDHFKMMSEWHHMAILSLIKISPEVTAASTARRLGINHAQALTAIDRLERLELIAKDPQGRYRRCTDNVLIQSLTPNEALKKYHKQMLQKAAESLDTQTPQERLIGTENLGFDEAYLDEANAAIEECFTKLILISKKAKKKKSLYHLGIQFFRLAKGESL